MKSSHLQKRFYPESEFGGFSDIDLDIAFFTRVNGLLEPSFCVVDLGCGRGYRAESQIAMIRSLSCLKGKVDKVIGLDVDPVGSENPNIDEFRQIDVNGPWPLEDHSVNLLFCDYVVEHLPDTDFFFSEVARVLVPGGYVCIRTSNVLGYVGLAAKLIPAKFHTKVLKKILPTRKECDSFPTLYRCNTTFALRRSMAKHGFRAAVYGYEAEPGYLRFSKLAYLLGVIHQRIAPNSIRVTIFAFGQLESK